MFMACKKWCTVLLSPDGSRYFPVCVFRIVIVICLFLCVGGSRGVEEGGGGRATRT